MAPSAVLRFKSRGRQGIFPAEPIAVPRSMLTIEFAELLPKLLDEFWPAVRDDVENVPEETPASVEAVTFTVNDKRAPKHGSLADVVEEDEDLDLCVVIKGADDIPGLWIPIESVKPVEVKKEPPPTPSSTKKSRKSTTSVKAEEEPEAEEEGDKESNRRKIKRWGASETNLLLSLVIEHGKGKWKKVLEMGEGVFDKHRTTVDLKDKWRNLEKSGVAPQLPENMDTRRTPGSRKKRPKTEETTTTPGQHHHPLAVDNGMTTGASEQLLAAVVAQQPGLLAAVTNNPAMAAFTAPTAGGDAGGTPIPGAEEAVAAISMAQPVTAVPIETATHLPEDDAADKTRNSRARVK